MPTYVVTGAARGLGYEFVRQFSALPDATVFGLVRNGPATEQKVQKDGLKNTHIIQADITDRDSLHAAAAQISNIAPSIDYLVNNAAYLGDETAFDSLTAFQDRPELLDAELIKTFRTNVIGVVDTINAFFPLIQKGTVKKVITIGSGMADDNLTNGYDVFESAPYSISKAAVNTVMAKYNAAHGKKDGILFLSLSPGVVATWSENPDASKYANKENPLPAKFIKAYPHWKGPMTPEESVSAMLKVIDRATVDSEFAGNFVSHFGDKKWL